MGMIGRWIDSLNDEQRDRIIEHPDPTFDGSVYWDHERECGCLVGAAAGNPGDYPEHWIMPWVPRIAYGTWVDILFPEVCERFTPERMWRVCKARAARRNAVNVAPVAEAVEAA